MPGAEIFYIFAFIFGSITGSFYNVIIYRLPRHESIVYPHSHCTACDAKIKWYDNIPVLSFIWLAGKCRNCKTRISWQYPAVEILSGAFALYAAYRWGLTLQGILAYFFASVLVVIAFIDLKHRIIPDIISIPGMVIFLGLSFFRQEIAFMESLLGLLVGGAIIYAVILIYFIFTKKEGMGGGDIKLFALIGAFLGFKSILFVLLFASLSGSIIGLAYMVAVKGDRKLAIPFGPFLAFGALLYLCCGPQIINLYLSWSFS